MYNSIKIEFVSMATALFCVFIVQPSNAFYCSDSISRKQHFTGSTLILSRKTGGDQDYSCSDAGGKGYRLAFLDALDEAEDCEFNKDQCVFWNKSTSYGTESTITNRKNCSVTVYCDKDMIFVKEGEELNEITW